MTRRHRRGRLVVAGLATLATAVGASSSAATTTPPPAAPESVPAAPPSTVPDAGAGPTTTPATSTANAPTATPTTAAAPVVRSADEAMDAVIRVVASGVQARPYTGPSTAGDASGFIIDPSGLAVTASHSVAGATSITVVVGDSPGRQYPAQILYSDECSNLAVIQIRDAEEPLPALPWSAAPPALDSAVSALGFDRITSDPVIIDGEITQTEGPGALQMAAVARTLRFTADARLGPGLGGGPLVDSDGAVVGVILPSDPETPDGADPDSGSTEPESGDTVLGRAISSDLARPIVERLRVGPIASSLGINGTAVNENGVEGIWVAGVDARGVAARAGILAGDLITEIGGESLGQSGTMASYCSRIQEITPEEPVPITVTRTRDQTQLYGRLNTEDDLQSSIVFANLLRGAESVGESVSPAPPTYDSYIPIATSDNVILTRIPEAWGTRSLDPQSFADQELFPTLVATTDLTRFRNEPAVPGIGISVHPFQPDVDAALAGFDSSQTCSKGAGGEYRDASFTGRYQVWIDCAGSPGDLIVMVLNDAGEHSVWIVAKFTSPADLTALDVVLRNLVVR